MTIGDFASSASNSLYSCEHYVSAGASLSILPEEESAEYSKVFDLHPCLMPKFFLYLVTFRLLPSSAAVTHALVSAFASLPSQTLGLWA